MPLFRFHRGGFVASMDTTVEVSSKEELCRTIRSAWGFPPFDDDDVKVSLYVYDPRNEWNTHIVSLLNGCVVGFTDGPIDGCAT